MTERKSAVDKMLDLFLYAPIGFVMNLEEVVPQLVERGHQQVNMARMFGQFAVDAGTKEARKRLESLAERSPRPAPSVAAPRAAEPASPATPSNGAAVEAAAPAEQEQVPRAEELAITDYDSLSASQVVPRLDGLSAEERDAVRRYEAARRARKTILSKLAQLG